MDITDFINAADECWRDIPNTNLEASSYGRLRNIFTKSFFGQVRYLEDLEGVLTGAISVWTKGSIVQTPASRSYFKYRTRHDRRNEDDFLLAKRPDPTGTGPRPFRSAILTKDSFWDGF